MEPINQNQLLQQLRQLAAQAGLAEGGAGEAATPVTAEFGQLLRQSLQGVSRRQQFAARLQEAFELEDPNVDLAEVMVESQKARVAFEALVQVRNRLVSAYQEIMNMPI